jgi:hypothetical protein
MPDAMTGVIIGGMVGGVAGEAAKGMYQLVGKKWVDRHYGHHHPAAAASAEVNTLDFFV